MTKRSSHAARRAVLGALCRLSAQGNTQPTIELIMSESSYPRRTCYRAMEDLEREGYMRRYRVEVLREEYER